MKKYFLLSIIVLLVNIIIADSMVYYFNDTDSKQYILKKNNNIHYLGIYNEELLIFKLTSNTSLEIPNKISEKLYSIDKKNVYIINYSGKKNFNSIKYKNINNNVFIDYLKTDKPLFDENYEIPKPTIIEPQKKEELIIKKIEKQIAAVKDDIAPSNHFTIGYTIKQNISILQNNFDMLNNFTCGYIWTYNSGKNNNIDVGIEYIPNINKSYYENKFLKMSLFDIYIHWRLPKFTNKLQSYIKFGASHILDFEIWGKNFKSEFNFNLFNKPDGGILYGLGLIYNQKLLVNFTYYNLFLNDSHVVSQSNTNFSIPPFNIGTPLIEPEIDMFKINIARLF